MPNYTWTAPPTFAAAVGYGPILEIPYADTRHSGVYSCTADNGLGSISREFDVTVAGKARTGSARARYLRVLPLAQVAHCVSVQ